MENAYNLHNIEASFKQYLFSGKISSISLKNYMSDFRHFYGWLATQLIDISQITTDVLTQYVSYLQSSSVPLKTINRRLSTLRHFCLFCLTQGWISSNPVSTINNICHPKTENKLTVKANTPVLSQISRFHRLNIYFNQNYIFLLFLPIVLFLLISIFYYTKYSNKKSQALTLSASIHKGKLLTFEGKLTDKIGNPIYTKTDVIFRLYNSLDNGDILYEGSCLGTDAVQPDENGTFKVIIGSDCNMSSIPLSIFYENIETYLGITIGTDPEMTPRQQIANVEYANNSSNLQGLTTGTTSNTIPYINQSGSMLITAPSPSIRSIYNSANFTLSSAKSIILQSAKLGDIILSATESGTIKMQTGKDVRVYIDNNGNVGIGTTTPTQGMNIANGDINIDNGYGLKYDNYANQGYYLRGDGTRFVPSTIQFNDLPLSATGIKDEGAVLRLTELNDKLGLGIASAEAKLHITNSNLPAIGKPLVILEQNENQNILVASASGYIKLALTREGRLGLGFDKPSYQLQLSEDSAAKPTSNSWTIVSDSRLKEDIAPFKDGLSVIEKINPVSYVLNGKANTPKGAKGIGVIAQNVKDIIPYTISRFKAKINPEDSNETELYSFDSSALTFVIINSVKELQTKINDLTKNLTKALENQNAGKIISPIIEVAELTATQTAKLSNIETNEIKPQEDKLVVNLYKDDSSKGKLSELIIKGLEGKTVTVVDNEGNIDTQGDLNARSATLSGTLTVNHIDTNTATISGIIADSIQTDDIVVNNATISGKLTVNEIDSDNIRNLEDKINNYINDDINQVQNILANIKNESLLNPDSYQSISSQSAYLSKNLTLDKLTVTYSTNLYDVSITNSLNIGNIFIQNNSLLSFSDELKISSFSQINFFEGDLIVSKGGNLTTKGTLTAKSLYIQNPQGDTVALIDSSGSAKFKDLTINKLNVDKYLEATNSGAIIASSINYNQNGIYAPAIEALEKIAGVGILPANSNEIIIYDESIDNKSLIYITPTSSTQSKSLFVSEKNACNQSNLESNCKKYFKVAIDESISNDINFNWWIIN